MRKYLLLNLLVAFIVALTLVGCSGAESNEEVTTEVVEETRNSIEVFGVVKSKDIQSVNVDIELKVVEILSRTGDVVSKGDKILKFDKKLVEDELVIYKQELELISRKLNKSDIGVMQLRNSLAEANNNLKIAEDRLSKDKELYNSGIITKSQLDETKQNFNQLASRVKDLKLSIESENLDNSYLDDENAVEYNKLKQKIESIENILNNSNIIEGEYFVSHIDSGVVTDLDLLVGEYIVPKNNIYKLVNVKDLYIEAEVSEEFINEMTVGQEVEVTPLFDKSKVMIGKVEKINGLPYIKNGETIVPIEISIDDIEGFMPNFNVDVTIFLD